MRTTIGIWLNLPLRRATMAHYVLVAALAAAHGCAAPTDPTRPDAIEPADVAAASAELLGSCEGRTDELRDFANWASNEAVEGLQAYDDDSDNELAVRYFGRNYDHALVRARLLRLVQLARSERLSFTCLEESDPACAKASLPVFFTLDTEWMRTDGWNISVCGDRFWGDEYVNGVDSGSDASQVGVMVHEIAHLTGAISDGNSRNEQAIIDVALDPLGSSLLPTSAESYRFYIMNTHF